MKKLALVWESDNLKVIVPLENVTKEVYDKCTAEFGKPKGRTEVFTDLIEEVI